MASLKELRDRRKSVQSTKKITSAMKMIAAAKLKRAQELAVASRPYATLMEQMIQDLSHAQVCREVAPPLLVGNGRDARHLIVVLASNRGLCGGFNSSVVRRVKRLAQAEVLEGKQIQILCVGRVARDQLRREYGAQILDTFDARDRPRFKDADQLRAVIVDLFERDQFDKCTLVYNKFLTALSQEVTLQQLIPSMTEGVAVREAKSIYVYEPRSSVVLAQALPKNLSVQIYRALLESAASEQGARMAAMDSATRNADEMLGKLTLKYNRTRQAQITRELIEIISGAEAL